MIWQKAYVNDSDLIAPIINVKAANWLLIQQDHVEEVGVVVCCIVLCLSGKLLLQSRQIS